MWLVATVLHGAFIEDVWVFQVFFHCISKPQFSCFFPLGDAAIFCHPSLGSLTPGEVTKHSTHCSAISPALRLCHTASGRVGLGKAY